MLPEDAQPLKLTVRTRRGRRAGLFRVRGFTQDDAHIFCLPEQIAGEIVGVLALVEEVMGAFGFQEFEVGCPGARCAA
jgi:threonyl-tRNA synthetase